MKNYFVLGMVSICLLMVSCNKDSVKGSGSIITEPRSVVDFYNVSVSGSTNVFITQGNSFDVKVKAYENIIPFMETKVQDGTLFIGFKSNANVSNDNSEVYITMPSLNSLAVSGSGNIDSKGSFLGSGNFKSTISGSGNIVIQGATANNYQINISGSGSVKSFGMVSKQAVVSIIGSGNAELTVLQDLNATIDGSGNVYYKGATATVTSKITGSGQVIKQ
ncbi:MAG: head GIN domain-containing protein [Ginsengibacter sp.]